MLWLGSAPEADSCYRWSYHCELWDIKRNISNNLTVDNVESQWKNIVATLFCFSTWVRNPKRSKTSKWNENIVPPTCDRRKQLIPEDRQKRCKYRVTIVNVEVIPATLCGKLDKLQPTRWIKSTIREINQQSPLQISQTTYLIVEFGILLCMTHVHFMLIE